MPEPIEFEKIRNKMADDLLPEEIDVIVENKDKLNDEEKAAFNDVIQASTPFPDDPNDVLNQNINQAVDNEDGKPPVNDPSNQPPATPTPPVTPPTPPPTPTVPQTQEQLDAYLEQKRKQWETEGKSAKEQKEETDKIQQFFDAGFMPKDWNDAAQQMWKKMAPLMEQQIIAKLDARNKEFYDNQEKIKQTQTEVMQRFEKEFDTLSESGLIPKRDDPQYKDVRDQIWKIGDNNGKTNITDAYKLWSIIPVEHGGGLIVEGSTTDPNAKLNKQKEAASKIRSGRGVVGAPKGGTKEWAHVHTTNMDDLLDKAKSEAGIPY